MRKLIAVAIFVLGLITSGQGQKTPEGSFEFSFLGSEFVDRASFGIGVGINKFWHKSFQVGLHLQSSFNRQRNRFGYEVGSPYYSATALTLTNTAHLFRLGRFSMEANANFGWLFLSLQDEDFQEFNPAFGFFEPETIANESFRFLQGGLTLNYVVSRRSDKEIVIFLRALQNQALGNVRFGGEDANSGLQFNLGVKLNVF